MTGRLSMRGLLMTYELEAASPRLAVSGTGRIELNDEMDAEMSFRVTDTSLDPYLRVAAADVLAIHVGDRQRHHPRRRGALQP